MANAVMIAAPSRERPPNDTAMYVAAISTLAVFAIAITLFGHLGTNGRIYAFFARLSNAGVDIFNPHSLSSWNISWTYLDFTPFNLLLYKLLFWSKGSEDGVVFRAYQFSYLFLSLYCTRRLTLRGVLTRAQERSLIVLIAFNLPLYLTLIGTSEDKLFYLAIPLAMITLSYHPCFQALLTGVWTSWSGSGLFFLPIAAMYYARRRRGRWWLLCLLLAGVLLAALPFFPESRVMLANRAHREAVAPFSFSIWRLIGPVYFPALNKLAMLLYASAVWLLYAKRRLAFTPALVAVCLSYCLFSNNTYAYRNFTSLMLAVLLIRDRLPCYLFTAMILLQELLNVLSKVKSMHHLGLFDLGPTSHFVFLTNMAIVNAPILVAMAIAFLQTTGSCAADLAEPLSGVAQRFAGYGSGRSE